MTEDRNDQSSSFRGAADHFREKPIPQWARDPLQQVSSRLQRHWISSLLLFFLPSFVSSYFRPNSSTARTKPLHETAYLDGLRGVAAFVVYLHHTQLMYRRDSLYGYGSIPDSRHFLQLPFFRIIVGGQAAVTLFFVISGYVLSIKTLSQIYENQYEKVLGTLSGSVFRRGLRLFLPFAAITWFLAVNAHTDFPIPIAYGEYRLGTFHEQMIHWRKVLANTINPLHPMDPSFGPTAFLGPGWTLPLEFSGSMMIFMLLLALARAKRWVHALVVFVIGVYWPLAKGDGHSPFTASFCAGMLLAEMAIVFPPTAVARFHNVNFFKGTLGFFHQIHQGLSIVLFICAVYLLSAPQQGLTVSMGFVTLSEYIPAEYDDDPGKFLTATGSILLVLVIMYAPFKASTQNIALPFEGNEGPEQKQCDAVNTPLLRRLFTNRVSQYLGRISYSLYLWHEPVKAVVGVGFAMNATALRDAYYAQASTIVDAGEFQQLDRQYYWDFFWLLIPGFLWSTFWVVWVSDVFCRAVDEPSVRFARKLSQWVEK